MTPERWKRITEVFYEICELPEDQQPKRLEELCAGDAELLEQVQRLLRSAPSEGQGFIDNPPLGDALARFTTSGRRLDAGEILAERFVIIRHLGSGGMGEVYEAEDRHLHASVAIKLIRLDIADQSDALARFRREITLARQVTHRSVCRVYDFFPGSPTSRGDRVDFLTMELLSGETLAEMMEREAPMPLSRALPILEQITSALDAAHSAGVLHRDLKGSNVFLTTENGELRAVITDFGLARSASGGDAISTGSAWGIGTPLFMSPEQLEGGEVGPQSDIYSLGVLMHQMATGVAPLQGNSPLQIAVKRVKEQPRSPRDRNPNIDPVWESAILRCLALEPKGRFQKGSEVMAALERERKVPQLGTRPALLAGAAVVVAIAAGGWWAVDRFSTPPVSPEVARWYREGEVALADGAMTKASKLFERALQSDPKFLSVRCRLAEAYVELDMTDRAQEQILQSVDGRHRSAEERLLCEGVKATLIGQWDQALATAKDRPNAQLDEARWNERAGRNAVAAAIYESLIKADGSQPGPQLRLANIRTREGKNAEAAVLLDQAETNYKALGNAEGAGEVALSRSRIAKTVPEAIALAEVAIQRGKDTGSDWLLVRAMLWHADRLQRLGNLEDVRQRYQAAIELAESAGLAGQAVNGKIDLGYVSYAQRNYEEAEPQFRNALILAQRYRTQRAEARSRLSLGQLYTVTGKVKEAHQLIGEALNYYRSVGDVSQVAQSLNFRANLLQSESKFEESRASFMEALATNPGPREAASIRQRLAFLALRQTRYEEAARRYTEVIEFHEQAGDPSAAQTSRIDRARALTLAGLFEEAESELARIRKEKPANDSIRLRYDFAQSTLDFQQLRFDASTSRMEVLLADAVKRKATVEMNAIKSELCVKYAEAGQFVPAARHCDGLVKQYASQPTQPSVFHYALAQIHMSRKEGPKAVAEARQALALSENQKDRRNVFYDLLILTQALHMSANPEWKSIRERARAVLTELSKENGESAVKSYLNRPLISRRYKAVEELR